MTATKKAPVDPWKTLTPTGRCVIVREAPKEGMTVGGILLPEASKEQPPEGEVLGIGPLAWEDGESEEFHVGERVVFMPHAGQRVSTGGEVVKVMRVSDVIAVRR